MPLDQEAKKAYQKEYMAKRREQEKVQRALGNEIITPGEYEPGHKHVWKRKLGEDTAICECLEVVRYTGKLLTQYTDGLADTSELISEMEQQDRDQILNHPIINTRRKGDQAR